MRVQLPPPENWQDFEALCLEVWRNIWCDPNAQKNGRQGQPQCGVDVFGHFRSFVETSWCGGQCKLRSQLKGGTLSPLELANEAARAENFDPGLGNFTVATTAPRDVKTQQRARELSGERRKGKLFGVQVYAWDDIADVIHARPNLMRSLYSEYFTTQHVATLTGSGIYEGTIPGLQPIAECEAFFDSPEIRGMVVEVLRVELRNVITELALNSFQHGKARMSRLQCSSKAITFMDNGSKFNPLNEPADLARGVGLVCLKHFLAKWKSELRCAYVDADGWNSISFTFSQEMSSASLSKECIIIAKGKSYASCSSMHAFADIPKGCREYRFNVPAGAFNPSSLNMFLRALFGIIDPQAVVVLTFEPWDLM